jgi:hypothetical protein
MYGTVARMQLKPGSLEKMQAHMKQYEGLKVPGHLATFVYQMDQNSNEVYLAVAFDSKESYVKNAQDPSQDARYRQMMEFLAAEPEWHDGEIIYEMK